MTDQAADSGTEYHYRSQVNERRWSPDNAMDLERKARGVRSKTIRTRLRREAAQLRRANRR